MTFLLAFIKKKVYNTVKKYVYTNFEEKKI